MPRFFFSRYKLQLQLNINSIASIYEYIFFLLWICIYGQPLLLLQQQQQKQPIIYKYMHIFINERKKKYNFIFFNSPYLK